MTEPKTRVERMADQASDALDEDQGGKYWGVSLSIAVRALAIAVLAVAFAIHDKKETSRAGIRND